jgi:hypothetical protein
MQIIEQPIGKKDYRSFAAAVFGTVAFKMLEWLAPKNIEALSHNMETSRCPTTSGEQLRVGLSSDNNSEQSLTSGEVPRNRLGGQIPIGREVNGYHAPGLPAIVNPSELHSNPLAERPSDESTTRSPHRRRRSNAKIRTSSSSQPPKVVVEPLLDSAEEIIFGSPDRISKGIVRPSSTLRCASQPCREVLPDTDADGRSSEQSDHEYAKDGHITQIDGLEDVSSSGVDIGSISLPSEDSPIDTSLEPASELDSYLPQSLSRLNLEAVNFLCDVLEEDATTERHMLEPPVIGESLRRYRGRRRAWKRKQKAQLPYSQNLKYEWKLFIEQSIFHVLSDPQAVLESFTTRDGAVDSQTVWYCMLRLTRAAPHLVFDSLWMALTSLFAAPGSLQSSRSSTAKVFATSQKSFSNAETASLITICIHALVAAAPLVTDSRQLLDISRLRSHGLSLPGSGAVARPPTLLCLQYEDAFTDDLALRLARRLLMVIPTRRYFDELINLDLDLLDRTKEPDMLETLLSHIEPSMQSFLRFSKSERSIHEKRIPILLLDWARAVMIQEWTGKPDVPGDGPFGGALMLIAAMCKSPYPRFLIWGN